MFRADVKGCEPICLHARIFMVQKSMAKLQQQIVFLLSVHGGSCGGCDCCCCFPPLFVLTVKHQRLKHAAAPAVWDCWWRFEACCSLPPHTVLLMVLCP